MAQFHVNENRNNRSRLHRAVVEAFSSGATPTTNHRLLAQLPITTWWTTNYDKLIEAALREAGKVVDVKHTVAQLAITAPRRDAIVYKMHGDVEHPDQAVATRDDYEGYSSTRGAYINALAGDLVSKTFLFLGFSFTDPNLEHVLSRIRLSFKQNQRRHYAVFRTLKRKDGEDQAAFDNALRRQALVLGDLERFNVKAVMVDEYEEVTEILEELVRRHRRRTVFVSASAADFSPWTEAEVVEFMRELGSALVGSQFRVATGLGLGVGNALFTGAVEEILRKQLGHIEDHVIARPFPQAIPEAKKLTMWREYRRDLVERSGIALFLFGNKDVDGVIVPADGLREEFELAQEAGVVTLPIGATGSVAAVLAKGALEAPTEALPLLDGQAIDALRTLSEPTDDLKTLIRPIMELLRAIKASRS